MFKEKKKWKKKKMYVYSNTITQIERCKAMAGYIHPAFLKIPAPFTLNIKIHKWTKYDVNECKFPSWVLEDNKGRHLNMHFSFGREI